VTLTAEQFNNAVNSFAGDVARAVNCFSMAWSVNAELASLDDSDRMRAVIDAKVALRDGLGNGLAELKANYKLCADSYGKYLAVEHSSFVLNGHGGQDTCYQMGL
jgi:hypothetical protein